MATASERDHHRDTIKQAMSALSIPSLLVFLLFMRVTDKRKARALFAALGAAAHTHADNDYQSER
jgi:general stress protein CsbA